ncbi:lysine biosynthesis protein LysW [Candidatus Bipolaricaulota bacterium]|jgi:lysine biosynthesis protein LysW|nr:lysine biosynthesis protein LysW [Candidatus Bipolaricaulota bacterium]MCK4599570.1 lysine biosynthesis protein LysW [Candidatus Bipolaricaulota bacterium]
MATAKCPVCGADISVEEEDIVLFKRMRCPKCDARLEIINDFPLRLGRFDRE